MIYIILLSSKNLINFVFYLFCHTQVTKKNSTKRKEKLIKRESDQKAL